MSRLWELVMYLEHWKIFCWVLITAIYDSFPALCDKTKDCALLLQAGAVEWRSFFAAAVLGVAFMVPSFCGDVGWNAWELCCL